MSGAVDGRRGRRRGRHVAAAGGAGRLAIKAGRPERLHYRHRLLGAIDKGNHPDSRVALAPGTVAPIWAVTAGTLDLVLPRPLVRACLNEGVPVVVVLESARDAAELHARVESKMAERQTGAPVQ